jgi:hypothetical protein
MSVNERLAGAERASMDEIDQLRHRNADLANEND